MQRLFKLSFTLDVFCSRDTLAENSAASSASKPTTSRAFFRVQSQYLASEFRALCVPQGTVLRASSDPRSLCGVNLLYADLVLLNIRALGILRGIVGYVSVTFGAHIIRAVHPPQLNSRFSSTQVPHLNRVTSQSHRACRCRPARHRVSVPDTTAPVRRRAQLLHVFGELFRCRLLVRPVRSGFPQFPQPCGISESLQSSTVPVRLGPVVQGLDLELILAPLTSRRSAEHSTRSTSVAL